MQLTGLTSGRAYSLLSQLRMGFKLAITIAMVVSSLNEDRDAVKTRQSSIARMMRNIRRQAKPSLISSSLGGTLCQQPRYYRKQKLEQS